MHSVFRLLCLILLISEAASFSSLPLRAPPRANVRRAESGDITRTKRAVVPEPTIDSDPREALKQFGSLFEQLKDIATEGSSWDADTLDAKAQDFAGTYVRVLIPGISYTATQFALFAAVFVSAWTTLAVSGLGYTNLVDFAGKIEPLQNLLERVDPAWGNTALSLLVLELLSPLLVGASLALTPKTVRAVTRQLEDWELDEAGMRRKVSELLKDAM